MRIHKAVEDTVVGETIFYMQSLAAICWMCASPCAFQVILLGFLLAPLSWFKVLQDQRVRLSAPLRHCAKKLRKKNTCT